MSKLVTALERQALFRAAVVLRETTMQGAAATLGVSYNHLVLVLRGERLGSVRLEQAIAAFVRRPVKNLFPPRQPARRQRHAVYSE